MLIQLNLSPYIIQFLNSCPDANASQVVEQVMRQYMNALKTQIVVEVPQTQVATARIERQRTSVPQVERPEKPRLERKLAKGPITKKAKKVKPTR